MTGRELLADTLATLQLAATSSYDFKDYPDTDLLRGCVLLTPAEREKVRRVLQRSNPPDLEAQQAITILLQYKQTVQKRPR